METKNESEKVFEQYLDSNEFQGKWAYEPSITGKTKHPDYLLDFGDKKCFFEVKELRKKDNEPTERAAYIDPYSGLRKKIHKARKQLKEFKEYPCSLVVYNIDDRQFRAKPLDVFGAMLGNIGFRIGFDSAEGQVVTGAERNVFLEGGKMVVPGSKKSRNTTISAIVVLEIFRDNIEMRKASSKEIKKQGRKLTAAEKFDIRKELYEKYPGNSVPRVVVVENPFARVAFPADLFNGPFDERWRMGNDKQERVFVGSKLRELESLKCDS
ncbi:MAG: hypothetical protein ISS79_03660 [Phycisphaerae bacterium]|nr:hypothetical protein [Phycisphaerae bacterium]